MSAPYSNFTTNAVPINTEVTYDAVYDASTQIMNTVIMYDGISQNIQITVVNIGGSGTNSLRFLKDHRNLDDINHPAKIGEHRIYEDDVLIGHYIPVRRDSDGKMGMYDLVTNTFLNSSGEGTLAVSPDLNVFLPSGN